MKQLIANNKSNFKWLKPPNEMTEINISYIRMISDADEYYKKVKEWAYYIFKKWTNFHDVAKAHLEKIK